MVLSVPDQSCPNSLFLKLLICDCHGQFCDFVQGLIHKWATLLDSAELTNLCKIPIIVITV
jgi:hypothetical protein